MGKEQDQRVHGGKMQLALTRKKKCLNTLVTGKTQIEI